MRVVARPRVLTFLAVASLLLPCAHTLALYQYGTGLAQEHQPAEWAKRDAWQHPEAVMDALGIKPGSVVADVGCGGGYFTFRLAERVGPQGKVYAEDIDWKRIRDLDMRLHKEPLAQVQTLFGKADDPHLPAESLDVILVVDTYHEMDEHEAMLKAMYQALKPGGLLGVIDRKGKAGQPRSSYHKEHHIPPEIVQEEITGGGFQFLRREFAPQPPDSSLEYFFLVFQKPAAAAP